MKNFTQIEDTDCSDDREINQARSKPDPVNRPVRTARMSMKCLKHNYLILQYFLTSQNYTFSTSISTDPVYSSSLDVQYLVDVTEELLI